MHIYYEIKKQSKVDYVLNIHFRSFKVEFNVDQKTAKKKSEDLNHSVFFISVVLMHKQRLGRKLHNLHKLKTTIAEKKLH